MSTGVQGFLPVSGPVFDFAYDEDVVFPTPAPPSNPANPVPRQDVLGFNVPLTLTQRKLYCYIVMYVASGQGLLDAEIVLKRNGSPVGKIPIFLHNFFGTAGNPLVVKSTPSPFASGGIPTADSITLFLMRELVNTAQTATVEPTLTPVVFPFIFKGEFDQITANINHVVNVYSYRLWVGCASSAP